VNCLRDNRFIAWEVLRGTELLQYEERTKLGGGNGVTGSEGTRSEKQKMLAGELYNAGDPELQADIRATQKWLAR